MSEFEIYGLGNALVDTEVTVTDADLEAAKVDKGLMTLIDAERYFELRNHFTSIVTQQASGGSGANTVVGAAQILQKPCYYTCKVADDEPGHFYLKDMKRYGVKTNMQGQPTTQGNTGLCYVMITPDHERSMSTFLGVSSDLSKDDLDLAALASSKWFYVEGYVAPAPTAHDTALEALKHARSHGVKTSMSLSDPNMAGHFRSQLEQMLTIGVDLLFCNEEEAMIYSGSSSLNDAVEFLKKETSQFVITLGARGALAWDGEMAHQVTATPVDVVDTNGAGDAFAAGTLAGLCQGKSLAEAATLGTRTAGQVVSQFGPRLTEESVTTVC